MGGVPGPGVRGSLDKGWGLLTWVGAVAPGWWRKGESCCREKVHLGTEATTGLGDPDPRRGGFWEGLAMGMGCRVRV